MYKLKILFACALGAFYCVTFCHSIKCFYCDSKESCKKPKLNDCTPTETDRTRIYLALYHKDVPFDLAGPDIECFSETVKTKNDEFRYKGCIYQAMEVCKLELRVSINRDSARACQTCNHKDGCNPAGRAELNLSTVFGPAIILALIAKSIWSN